MGGSMSMLAQIVSRLPGRREAKLVMVGLDGAGKTTVLYRLHRGATVTTIPTIGFNVETLTHKGLSLTVWDIGGQDAIRKLWRHYYQSCEGLIFVVDSNDRHRLEDAREELQKTLEDSALEQTAVLVLANKQDLPDSMPAAEVQEKIGLKELAGRSRKWFIQPTSAVAGDGVTEGFDWLAKSICDQRRGR